MLQRYTVATRLIWLLLTLAIVITGCSHQSDDGSATALAKKTMQYDHRLKTPVRVTVSGGIATLSGYVSEPLERLAAVEDAAHTEGVRVVVDNLKIHTRPSDGPLNPVTNAKSQQLRAKVPHIAAISEPNLHALPIRSISPTLLFSDLAKPAVASPPAREGAAVANPAAVTEPVTVLAGTTLTVRLLEAVSSADVQPGDTFRAALDSPVMVDGKTVIPAGADVEGKVVEVSRAGRFSGKSKLAVTISGLSYNGQSYPLRTSQYLRNGPSRESRSAAIIGGGAGAGAILGAILGGGKGAALGAIIGAAAGTGAQASSKVAEAQLLSESVLSFRLQRPITVSESPVRQAPSSPGSDSVRDSSGEWRPVLKRRPASPPAEPDSPKLEEHQGESSSDPHP